MERAGGEVVCSSPAADTVHPKNRALHSDSHRHTLSSLQADLSSIKETTRTTLREVKMPKIVRPENCQPARTLWYDRKKYVTINFVVQNPKDVQVDIQDTKVILSCKDVDDNNIYNEIEFYDKVFKADSREKVFDRTINLLIRKVKENVAWPRLQKDLANPAWLLVDFDNWRDWEHEEEEGMAEYEDFVDMLNEMKNKGEPPAMDDLDDLSD
uniref:CS domain-containing protein n=1 Tax=Cyprinus carpio TaxID=7962 RepID=A0A8C1YD20_CYPCA